MVRLSDGEWAHVKTQARLAGTTASELLRGVVRGVDLAARPHAMVNDLYYEFARVGSNLRQLERIADGANQGEIVLDIRPTLTALSAWLSDPPKGPISDGSRTLAEPIPEPTGPRQCRGFRSTEEEWRSFKEDAEHLEKKATSYLRELVLDLDLMPRKSPIRRSAMRRLVGLGRRLNRCAKRANEHSVVVDPLDVRAAADEVLEWLEQTRSRASR